MVKKEFMGIVFTIIIGVIIIVIVMIMVNPVPYTEEICDSKDFSYNIEDFVIDYQECRDYVEECLSYEDGVCKNTVGYCDNRVISCSLTINNLDDKDGVWGIDIEFYEENTNNLVSVDSRAYSIFPQSSEFVQSFYSALGREKGGEHYTCRYSVTSVPNITTCEIITKYKRLWE